MSKILSENNIINLLNKKIEEFKFKNRERKRAIIFWYDDNKEFENFIKEEFESVKKYEESMLTTYSTELFTNTELILYENNSFRIRYYIEKEELSKNLIIYLPIAKPKDEFNFLLDIESEFNDLLFIPNSTSVLINDIGLSEDLREKVNDFKDFFKSKKRINDFIQFKNRFGKEITNDDFDRIVTCTLLGISDYTDEGILKELFYCYYEDRDIYDDVFKWGAKAFIDNLLNRYFSYKLSEDRDLKDLIYKIMITAFANSITNIDKINKFGQYVLNNNVGNSALFIDSIRRDKERDIIFDKMSDTVFTELKFYNVVNECETNELIKSDLFKEIDELIISRILIKIFEKDIDYENLKSIIYDRKFSYFYDIYKNQYEFLICCIKIIESTNEFETDNKDYDFDNFIDYYYEKLYIIDEYYRKINFNYDSIYNKNEFTKLLDWVDNIYINKYLFKVSNISRNTLLRLKKYELTNTYAQQDFYKKYIEKYEEKKERAIVIISDAMRYEVAHELKEKLLDLGAKVKIDKMLGVVPSYTKLGMAAILPHKSISLDYKENGNEEIIVDGVNQSGTENRKKILEKQNENNTCFLYTDLINVNKADWKKMFSGKKNIYIYHDKIDKVGEHDEKNIFKACEECINELFDFVKQLDTTFSGVQIFITSDHGFFYKRSNVESYEKVNKDDNSIIQKTRFAYKINEDNYSNLIYEKEETIEINMNYLLKDDNKYIVSIPKSTNTFIRQGSGFNYIHGGFLPQEIVIPVIDFKSIRKKESVDEVGISLSSISNKITSSVCYLNFIQNQNVDDEHRACRYTLHFEDENEKIVSTETEVIAEYKNTEVEKRVFKEKFTFKDEIFDKNKPYFLVGKNDKNIEVLKEKFYIDILIPNYFD